MSALFLDDPQVETATTTTTHTIIDGDHGRIETRTAVVSTLSFRMRKVSRLTSLGCRSITSGLD
jgi:hypothetical protein